MDKTVQLFKELGQFLGKKLDSVAESIRNTPQKIQVDMSDTSKRIEELRLELGEKITSLTESLTNSTKDNYKYVEMACSSLCQSLETLEKELSEKEFNITTPDLSPALQDLKTTIENLVSNLSKTSSSNKTELQRIMKEVHLSISSLEETVKRLELPKLEPVVSEVEKLTGLLKEKNTKAVEILILKLIEAIEKIKIEVPTTFRLDEMQLRKISGSQQSVSVNGGQLAARKVTITNVSLTSTSTEYSYTFPANTVSWRIKLRDQGTLLYYSFTTGTLPSSGDGSNYMTAPQNFIKSMDGVDWSGKVVYLGAESASQTAEIEVYTL